MNTFKQAERRRQWKTTVNFLKVISVTLQNTSSTFISQITSLSILQLTSCFSFQQTFVWMPTYLLLSSENITGEFSASFRNDKSVRGNATLELWVRPGSPVTEKEREFKLVSSHRVIRVSGVRDWKVIWKRLSDCTFLR